MAPPLTAARVRELLAAHTSVSLPSSAELSELPDASRFLDGLVEASFLVSHGDKRLAPSEMGCLVGTLAELSSGALDRSALAGMIYEFSAALERDGLDVRLDALAQRFVDPRERLRLLTFASLVAVCDRALQPGEREVLQGMASRMSVPREEIDACVDALQKSLHDAA